MVCFRENEWLIRFFINRVYLKDRFKLATKLHKDIAFYLRASNGLSILYIGYKEINIWVIGQILNRVGVLVVRNSSDYETYQRKKRVPVILGMNTIVLYNT